LKAAPAPALRDTVLQPSPSAMEFLLDKIKATKNNADFFDSMRRG
jgi:transcription termination factor Rho